MPALIYKDEKDTRTVIYNATEADEPLDKMFTYVHLMPIEIDKIKNAKSEEVQKLLRKYI